MAVKVRYVRVAGNGLIGVVQLPIVAAAMAVQQRRLHTRGG